MPVFFVHDVNHGIVKPLDRKFRVREINPVNEVAKSQAVHSKEDSNQSDFQSIYPKSDDEQSNSEQKKSPDRSKAIKSYQENIPPPSKLSLGKVKDIMSSPVVKIFHDKTLASAWSLMLEHDIHHLIILNDEYQYCGLLSEKLITPYLMRYASNQQGKHGPNELLLKHFCDQNLLSTHPETELHDLGIAIMEYGLDAIAVSENSKIIGIVTKSDILKVILKHQKFEELA
jgi:CBS domain-containing protein